jgi:hypothetical protein
VYFSPIYGLSESEDSRNSVIHIPINNTYEKIERNNETTFILYIQFPIILKILAFEEHGDAYERWSR